ncbi:3-ketoacyl-ACP reductase [bacterium SM23_57]|nr:MAG: 3-ketoacyl-ACP reductase [bacterium SM23_57]
MTDRPVAVVTGAAKGIGRAIAVSLSSLGYDIAGIDLSLETTEHLIGLNELQPDIEANSASFLALRADISEIRNHADVIDKIDKVFSRIDILVNNAGVAPLERLDVLETTPESFDRVLGINLRGPFFFTQCAVRSMIRNIEKISDYHPKIIFITSISAEVSSINRPEYCISKAGLSMASRVFADRLANSGINVYEIRPGIIQTDMTASVKEKYDKLIASGVVPQKRWGYPEDVAKAVVAIAQGHFDYSTGMTFEVSGGMNIQRL